jgi:hypothetical protein
MKEQRTMTSISKGATVTFLPGPRATAKVTGKVKDTVTSGEGRGRSTFLVVACTDGRDRKIRPGACQIAA